MNCCDVTGCLGSMCPYNGNDEVYEDEGDPDEEYECYRDEAE